MNQPAPAGPIAVITPRWPAPPRVHAAFTTRTGGVSTGPYASLNIGSHVGDVAEAVNENRHRVYAHLGLPKQPAWVEQVHGVGVLELDGPSDLSGRPADAVIARRPGAVCVIQVADCMPVLFAAADGSAVAAAHAGWRGLAAGVLEAAVEQLGLNPSALAAWIGPAIGPQHFEVGAEVRAAFMTHDAAASAAFAANARGRWQCDLGALARQRLSALGVGSVTGGEWCTYAHPGRFFSYRRDGQCGRMAALIWLT